MKTFNLTADGSTDAMGYPKAGQSPGVLPEIVIVVSGTFGSGTVTVEYSVDGSTWAEDATALSFSDAGKASFKAHHDLFFRATLAGATSPDITVSFLD